VKEKERKQQQLKLLSMSILFSCSLSDDAKCGRKDAKEAI